MRDVFVTLVVAGMLPAALLNPFAGVALWTWLSVMNPHRLTWGFAYNFPFAQAAAIATLLGLAINVKKVRFPVKPVTLVLVAFLAWMNITMLFAIHFDESIEMWSRVNKTLLMTLVALAVVRSERQIRIFLWIFVMSVAFFGIKGGIFAIATGGESRVYGPPNSHIDDNNSISVALLMMIPLMAFLQQQSKHLLIKVGMFAAILLCVVSVFASYSRGAFVAGCAMATMLAIKSRKRVAYLVVISLSLAIILAAMPQQWSDRMATILGDPDMSVQGRFNAWGMAWNLALDRPIFGGGFAIYNLDVFQRYAPIPDDVHSAHNNFFQVLGEHGFVGLTLFLLLAVLMWRTGTRVIRVSRTPETRWRADLARALQVGMVGFLVGGLSVNIAYWDVYYFMLVLLVALENAASEANRAAFSATAGPAFSSGHARL
jgi:probable O-glycosylation ligase (exosortase A-associated)